MSADTTAFYILIFLIAAISLVAIGVSVSYFLLFQKYKAYKEQSLVRHKEEADQFSKILEDAKRQSLLILNQAQVAAKEIISKSDEIHKANSFELSALVEANLKKHAESYDHALSAITVNIEKTFSSLPKVVETQISQEITKLISSLDLQMKTLQVQVGQSLHEPYEKALKDAEGYKRMRLQTFEDSLFNVLQLISKEVLRKELTVVEHEKLVIKALDEAKKEGLL